MAAIEVTISGVLFDKVHRTVQNVVLIGEATLTGLGVGGGPLPPGDGKPPYDPPGIWGGGNRPFPTPPINIPPMPEHPPMNPEEPKPPPEGGGWGWHPEYGWGYFPMGQSAGPKRK